MICGRCDEYFDNDDELLCDECRAEPAEADDSNT